MRVQANAKDQVFEDATLVVDVDEYCAPRGGVPKVEIKAGEHVVVLDGHARCRDFYRVQFGGIKALLPAHVLTEARSKLEPVALAANEGERHGEADSNEIVFKILLNDATCTFPKDDPRQETDFETIPAGSEVEVLRDFDDRHVNVRLGDGRRCDMRPTNLGDVGSDTEATFEKVYQTLRAKRPGAVFDEVPASKIVARHAVYQGRYMRLPDLLAGEVAAAASEHRDDDGDTYVVTACDRSKSSFIDPPSYCDGPDHPSNFGAFQIAKPYPLPGRGSYQHRPHFRFVAIVDKKLHEAIDESGKVHRMPRFRVVVAWDGSQLHIAPVVARIVGVPAKGSLAEAGTARR